MSLLPPKELRDLVGPSHPDVWDKFGARQARRIRDRVAPDQAVLDLGCGCGRIALHLLETHTGPYVGLDVDLNMIEWCQRNITARAANFTFVYADISNQCYNPAGRIRAVDYSFPFSDGQFDAVIAVSLFTHLLEREAERDHRESARVLRPGGRLIASHFVLDDESDRAMNQDTTFFNFSFGYGAAWVMNWQCPGNAVAYPEAWVRGHLSQVGFSTVEVEKSNWREADTEVVDQDWVIATR